MVQSAMGSESVYGVQVSQHGGMARLARSLLHVHLVFMVVYTVTGLVQMVSALSQSALPSDGQAASYANTTMLEMAKTHPGDGMFLGFSFVGGSIALFFVVRFGIQTNSSEMITGAMACDGCCAVCNCFIGCCGVLGLFALFAIKASYDSMDVCACPSVQDSNRHCSDPCSTCFDVEKCQNDVQTFQEGYNESVAMSLFWTILFCIEMLLCTLATNRLAQAKRSMRITPFCIASAPSPQPVGMTMVIGQPGGYWTNASVQSPQPVGTTVVIGQPVQGPVVMASPKVAV